MRSLDCDELVELVTAYLDGALDLDTRERFDLHLAECDGCENYLQQVRGTVSMLGRITETDLDPGFRDRLLESFRDFNS